MAGAAARAALSEALVDASPAEAEAALVAELAAVRRRKVAARARATYAWWVWAPVVAAAAAVLVRVRGRYGAIAAHVADILQVDASGRVAPLHAPLEAVPWGAYDGPYVARLLRALDADGRAAYGALFASGEAFAAPAAYGALLLFAVRRRRARAFKALLVAVVAADVAASLAHRAMLDAFPAAPAAPPPPTADSSLTEGAVGTVYDVPESALRLGPACSAFRWAGASVLGAYAFFAALTGEGLL